MKFAVRSSIYLLLLGLAIWWMGAHVVWLGDDLDYKYMMKGEIWQSWGKIKTVKDFFDSQLIHYQKVNGRFIAHSLVQIFNAKLGQQAFAVCNAIVYILFAFLIAKAGKVKFTENSSGILSAICISVLCFITKMMPTCQIGYIWGMTANIAWLLTFYRKNTLPWIATFAMLIAGIAVGNWQESISIGVCCGIGIWWIFHFIDCIRIEGCKFDWRKSWMLLGYAIGTASNCLAPSTISRVADITMPLADQLLISAYSFPAIIMLILCAIYIKYRHGHSISFSFKTTESSIPVGVMVCAIVFLVVFNIAIGIYSNRQLFGANLFAAILTLCILPQHRFSIFGNILASICVLALWANMYVGISDIKYQYDKILRNHAKSSDGSVYIDRMRVMTLGFPLRAKYYEDILGQFDNDIHHSLMKDVKHTRKGRTLKLKPTSRLDRESIANYSKGHFNVTLKEPPKGEAPREIIVYGHYPIPWIKASPRRMQIIKYSKRLPPYATAVIIPEFPFFTADSISIVP